MLNRSRMFGTLVAALTLLLAGAGTADAKFVITFAQSGPDVTAHGEGSLNFLDLSFTSFDFGPPFVNASSGAVLLGPVPPAFTDVYTGFITGPASFGSGGLFLASSGSTTAPLGTGVGIDGSLAALFVPGSYIADDPFTSDSIWSGTTLSALGLIPGTYTWTWGDGYVDSLEVVIPRFAAAAVPEPPSLALLLAGISVMGLVIYAARRKPAAA